MREEENEEGERGGVSEFEGKRERGGERERARIERERETRQPRVLGCRALVSFLSRSCWAPPPLIPPPSLSHALTL